MHICNLNTETKSSRSPLANRAQGQPEIHKTLSQQKGGGRTAEMAVGKVLPTEA